MNRLYLKTSYRYRFVKTMPLIFFLFYFASCTKWVTVPPPDDTITNQQLFNSTEEVQSAINGIYFKMIQGNNSFANYATTIFCGLSADELEAPVPRTDWLSFLQNNLSGANSIVVNTFWTNIYENLYRANAILEGLLDNNNLPDSVRKQFQGEAYFVRAFCNFYLVNLFGPIPLVTTANWRITNSAIRVPEQEVYTLIESDLLAAKSFLAEDYSAGVNERIIPNKTAAAALLSRVYLYQGDWQKAAEESSIVINNPALQLEALSNVFKYNSKEAIWQLKQNNARTSSFNVTPEGFFIRPKTINSNLLPAVSASTVLLENLSTKDMRRYKWIDSTKYTIDNKWYYFPGKYKQGAGEVVVGGTYTEYYMVLRLAEQLLIRAEAFLKLRRYTEAITDINLIRERAGLTLLASSLPEEEIFNFLIQERRMELFAEWGHRWFDLKRWGIVDKVLQPVKGENWQPTDKLFPIPDIDIARNPNLVQNEGY